MRAVIFANGVINDISAINSLLRPDDMLVIADGGSKYLHALNLLPDLLIGDMDSIDEEYLNYLIDKEIQVMQFPQGKDQTDLELAINEMVKRKIKEVLIIGALGGRIDQTIANIMLITHNLDKGLKISLDDGHEHIVLVTDHTCIEGTPGDTVSLIPLCQPVEGIVTKDLEYPLDQETLFPWETRGISNVMKSKKAKIKISSGKLLCIHTRQMGAK